MKALSYLTLSLGMLMMTGCDHDYFKSPKTDTRAMFVAGMPVHDRDYKLTVHEPALNEALSEDDQ